TRALQRRVRALELPVRGVERTCCPGVARHVPGVVPRRSEAARRARDRGPDGRAPARGARVPGASASARSYRRTGAAWTRARSAASAAAAAPEAAHAATSAQLQGGLAAGSSGTYAA